MKAVAKWLLYWSAVAVSAVIYLAAIASWVVTLNLAVLLPAIGIDQRQVTSESMAPTYLVGDRVWYHRPSGGDLIPGRAVGVQFGDDFYTHRVQSVDPATGLATLKGDGQQNVDVTKVSQENVAAVPFHVTVDAPTLWVLDQVEDRRVVGGLTLLSLLTWLAWYLRKVRLDSRDKRAHDSAWARVSALESQVAQLTATAGTSSATTSSVPDSQEWRPSHEGDTAS